MKMKFKDYIDLAEKYEVESFIKSDPIQFPRRFKDRKDIEVAAVIAAWLAYGRRSVFIPKIDYILTEIMGNKPFQYIYGVEWNKYKDNYTSLYRMTSWHCFASLCDKLHSIYMKYPNLEDALGRVTYSQKCTYYCQGLCHLLHGETMIPSPNSNCANKRVNMLLRWMIRKDSVVDIGLWKTLSPSRLLVPCDTHSLQSAVEFGIIPKVDESRKTCIKVTEFAKKVLKDFIAERC